MSKPNAVRSVAADYLSVIHRASDNRNRASGRHAVIQTNLLFNITGLNAVAQQWFGKPSVKEQNFFNFIQFDFIDGDSAQLLSSLHHTGYWSGDVMYTRSGSQPVTLSITASHIHNGKDEPAAVMIVAYSKNAEVNYKDEQLEAAEVKYDALLNTLPDGVVIIGADGKIASSNKRGASILGYTEEEVAGKPVAGAQWRAVRVDGTEFPAHQFPAIVSLQTGFPQRNVIMGIEQPGGNMLWFSVNSDALIRPGEFDPYAVVVSFSDITNFITTQKELLKSNERFHHITRVCSDAIWDFDLLANEIYRSENFCRLTGYQQDQTGSSLNWWFDKIHPEDQARVKQKLEGQLALKNERWEDEYRFEYADGSYKLLHDSGIILYSEGKPVRILGAIRDITAEKQLRKQLEDEQAQKQKAITLAAIQAQEQEKTKISRELHDNVNQILMSAKLYMETARISDDKSDVLLEKAIEYQLLALHEIRKLSRSLNSPAITATGLQESIRDIAGNLEALQQIKVEFTFDPQLEQCLNDDEKITVYRIIQEQTNNIIKYAAATEVKIRLSERKGRLILFIGDNGRGFDPSVNNPIKKGIGVINMNSRAAAHGGTLEISSAPGKGCRLEMSFPIA